MYWFRRKYRQIQRVIDFLPMIWNGFDFDYQYSIDLFKKQLERTADYLDSNRSYSMDAKQRASRIRTAIRLMDKVYEEDYSHEYRDKLEQLYGKDVLQWNTISAGQDKYQLKYEYEKWDNADEINEMRVKLFKESNEKQKRAHKLLWRYIEHNIQYWWD
jgi:hypothetical protein